MRSTIYSAFMANKPFFSFVLAPPFDVFVVAAYTYCLSFTICAFMAAHHSPELFFLLAISFGPFFLTLDAIQTVSFIRLLWSLLSFVLARHDIHGSRRARLVRAHQCLPIQFVCAIIPPSKCDIICKQGARDRC